VVTTGTGRRPRSPISAVLLAITLFVVAAALFGRTGSPPEAPTAAPAGPHVGTGSTGAERAPYVVVSHPPIRPRPQLPGGGYRIFGRHRFLVAYYGTAGTASMGVLGATAPDVMDHRLRRAGRPFLERGEHLQPVYELIVTVADRSPGPGGEYSHDIATSEVRRYLRAAHRNHALLLLDLQTGRAPFPVVARRWAWALDDPLVGLALDPEWRMGPHQIPASVVGSVHAAEVNRTSLWLSRLVRRHDLPQKLFVLHQFRQSMLPDIQDVVHRPGLAMVQHADGFGTQGQKLATYHAIARPQQFREGFKLFYRWDVKRFTPREVRRIRPAVSFVSYE
jgi:hypothetical protein